MIALACNGIIPISSTKARSRDNIRFIKIILSCFDLEYHYMVILGKKTGAVNMRNTQNKLKKFVTDAVQSVPDDYCSKKALRLLAGGLGGVMAIRPPG